MRDIFVRNTTTGEVTRVSVSSRGAEANAGSDESSLDVVAGSSISGNGRDVVFGSDASNLVAGDTNKEEDCFLHDLHTGRTERVSVASGGAQGTGECLQPAVSTNGRYVVFVSTSRLVPAASTGALEVFVRDVKTGRTRLVSMAANRAPANSACFRPTISADGRFIAFESLANNLVAHDTNNTLDVFLFDTGGGTTRRVSVTSTGAQANGPSYTGVQPSISADGRKVAFYTDATNLVGGDSNASFDVMLRDVRARTTRRISISSAGAQGNGASFLPSMTPDGRYVAFESTSSTFSPGSRAGADNVFVRDTRSRHTELLNHTSGGAINLYAMQYEHADISADGHAVAFASKNGHLVRGDTNNAEDVFVRTR